MGRTTFSGPVRSTAGFEFGSSGTQITSIVKGTVAVDPGSVADGATLDVDVTITGAAVGDAVIFHPPEDLAANLEMVGCWVSAANTVTVRLANNSGGAIDQAEKNWIYVLISS